MISKTWNKGEHIVIEAAIEEEDDDVSISEFYHGGFEDGVDVPFSTLTAIAAWVDEQRGIARGPSVEVATAPYTARIEELEKQVAILKTTLRRSRTATIKALDGQNGR